MGTQLPNTTIPQKPVIFHFITGLDVGGTETMLLRLLPMVTDEFEQVVCSLKIPGKMGLALKQAGIPVHSLGWRGMHDISAAWRLYQLLRKIRPAIQVNYLIHADLMGRVIGRLAGVTCIISSQRGSLLQWEWLRIFDRLLKSLVTRYVVQTEPAKQELASKLGLSRNEITVIPNGVMVLPLPPRSSSRLQLNLKAEGRSITCISQLRRNKGHQLLLEAFESLREKYPDTYLLLAGDGELRDSLEENVDNLGIRDHVHFLGERTDILKILAATDVFVLPTLAEGMSNALMEAMAAGVPCIASDIEVNKVLITDKQNGRLFMSNKVDSLQRVLIEVLSDKDTAAILGERARQTIESHFSLAHARTCWQELFFSLLKEEKA